MVTHAHRPQGAVRNCRRLGGSPALHPPGLDGLSQDAGHSYFPSIRRECCAYERAHATPKGTNCNKAFASLHCRGERDQTDRAIMCVYCKEAPACDHERDACEASRGERCIICGHDSAAFLYTPGPRRVSFWIPVGRSPKRKPFETSTQARRANVKGRVP
jgi:hypothetical protein